MKKMKNKLPCESTIERLINHLPKKAIKNFLLADEEIADSLWLAWQIKKRETTSPQVKSLSSLDSKSSSRGKRDKIDKNNNDRKSSNDNNQSQKDLTEGDSLRSPQEDVNLYSETNEPQDGAQQKEEIQPQYLPPHPV